ncbi:hypothetical protein M2451_000817 [Dysgonomonas sp. PFB1-18]|uniref:hypothetical protein n=1 Tax=unclassified Dysgonomonas TaxID=2630389 RepID=UPI0024772633|nr:MULTISPECIES: hypothetical protein [unclassified Dysgonomonas]MDH6308506.1 hypothetical protein [Dysgonomonas sp. PF1-14]MDH6338007.1 hypothetical protein [Dysgonomonas sp. PF1-16]MDH6379504.1 hypothetical protein [Dysgonomonas sp. PFB1-18]MDH6396835.1 hypothetical protein [Dysgonomonas sp. PF1-23]
MAKKDKKGNVTAVIVIVVGILVLLFFLKGTIYKGVVKYEDAGGRKSYELKMGSLTTYIDQSLPNDETLDATITIDRIVDLSQLITTKALNFSTDYPDSDPQKAFENGGANCVGYAAFMAATGNYLIKRFGLEKEWEAKPKKGKLYLFGNNMHKNAKSGWFKDHDFVVFRNKNTKEEIYTDPTAYEYFGVSRVDKRQK